MLRLQENVPQVYIKESRDFQLLIRLYDVLSQAVKFDVDTMVNVNDSFLIKEELLDLLCTKLGFFPKHNFDSNALRYILNTFPYLIKLKGSKKSINEAVNMLFRLENIFNNEVLIINNEEKGLIEIRSKQNLRNLKALEELMRYLLPIGYTYTFELSQSSGADTTLEITSESISSNTLTFEESTSVVTGSEDSDEIDEKVYDIYSVQVAKVSGSKDFEDLQEGGSNE